jgi:hypothetical protein
MGNRERTNTAAHGLPPQKPRQRNPLLSDPKRRDIVKAYAVEIAISMIGLIGTRRAAAFLKKYMVDIDVALRVLLHPSKRRNYEGCDRFALEGILPIA